MELRIATIRIHRLIFLWVYSGEGIPIKAYNSFLLWKGKPFIHSFFFYKPSCFRFGILRFGSRIASLQKIYLRRSLKCSWGHIFREKERKNQSKYQKAQLAGLFERSHNRFLPWFVSYQKLSRTVPTMPAIERHETNSTTPIDMIHEGESKNVSSVGKSALYKEAAVPITRVCLIAPHAVKREPLVTTISVHSDGVSLTLDDAITLISCDDFFQDFVDSEDDNCQYDDDEDDEATAVLVVDRSRRSSRWYREELLTDDMRHFHMQLEKLRLGGHYEYSHSELDTSDESETEFTKEEMSELFDFDDATHDEVRDDFAVCRH